VLRPPESRGYLIDRLTQRWVQVTGRKINLSRERWLDGPAGNPHCIGNDFFADYAAERGFDVIQEEGLGLLPDFGQLELPMPVAAPVRDFYERTSDYELDVWSEWCGAFRPFGAALAFLFSRRLQQLNVPLSALDPSRGMTNTVLQLHDRCSHRVLETAWIRELHATRNVLYAGAYSVCQAPGFTGVCLKVVFPLPNGNGIVMMKPEARPDGSFVVTSAGRIFGDPGFYFVVHGDGSEAWARYVPSLKEAIHVYPGGKEVVRADHVFHFFGFRFLRLHYRMRRTRALQRTEAAPTEELGPAEAPAS